MKAVPDRPDRAQPAMAAPLVVRRLVVRLPGCLVRRPVVRRPACSAPPLPVLPWQAREPPVRLRQARRPARAWREQEQPAWVQAAQRAGPRHWHRAEATTKPIRAGRARDPPAGLRPRQMVVARAAGLRSPGWLVQEEPPQALAAIRRPGCPVRTATPLPRCLVGVPVQEPVLPGQVRVPLGGVTSDTRRRVRAATPQPRRLVGAPVQEPILPGQVRVPPGKVTSATRRPGCLVRAAALALWARRLAWWAGPLGPELLSLRLGRRVVRLEVRLPGCLVRRRLVWRAGLMIRARPR
jgi:hypothetical protein